MVNRSAFDPEEISWRRPDVDALLQKGGLCAIDVSDASAVETWLEREGYGLLSLDCSGGFQELLRQIGALFRWEDQFGYRLEEASGNLNAVRDGFEIPVPPSGRVVLVIHDADALEERDWLLGLLSIASEHSIFQLALGCRFFVLLPLDPGSTLAGSVIAQRTVPWIERYRP
jgi:hypothetical protein